MRCTAAPASSRPTRIAFLPLLAGLLSASTPNGVGPVSKSWVDAGAPALPREVRAFGTLPTIFPLGSSSARWTYASDGSWIGEVAALGNRGTQVLTQHGDYIDVVPLLSAHDGDPPQPVWNDQFVELNFHRTVDSSEEVDAHVALHQRFVAGSTQWREAVLRAYDSGSPIPRWEVALPTPIASHPHATARTSRDGQTIVTFVYDSLAGAVQISVFAADSPTPVFTTSASIFGTYLGVALSGDGSTAAVLASQRLVLFDLVAQAESHAEYLFGPTVFGSLGLSGDGRRFAFGVDQGVRIYERDDLGAWSHAWTHPLPGGGFCRRLAISNDGGTLALGVNFPADLLTSRVEAVNLGTQLMTMSYDVVGSGSLQNQVADVDISEDGRRFAVGLWGDEPGDVPELLVFRPTSDQPILAEHLGGSTQDVDICGDGRSVVVASKGTHANVWGGGGAIRLFDVGVHDLELQGVPRPGATVTWIHRMRSGGPGRVYVAQGLSEPPTQLPDLGPGTVFLDPATMVSLGDVAADSEGVATTAYTIPDDAGLIGSSLYFQALALDGTGFSKRWIRMTVLP